MDKDLPISDQAFFVKEDNLEKAEKIICGKTYTDPVPVPGKKVRQKTGSKYNELDM